MKVYLLRESDFERLLTAVDRNPRWGVKGGSSQTFTDEELKAHEQAHSFFNYQVRDWIDKVKQDGYYSSI